MLKPSTTIVCALALLAGCADPVDKAAKARIFSPEAPPQVVASASEALPPEQLSQEPQLARRVLTMGAAEATERLGSFRYRASLKFSWTTPASLLLTEERLLEASIGGVGGDFRAQVDNSRDQGLEVIRSGGRVFAKSRYGTLRERKRDRGMAERAREEVFSGLRDFTSLFDERLQIEPRGTVSHQGRNAWRFVVTLGAPSTEKKSPSLLPAPAFAKGGGDETTRRRLAFFEKREPQSLAGELLVDAESSVVLKAKLDGTLRIPDAAGGKAALVQVSLDGAISDVGKVGKVPLPENALPDTDKPPGIAEALERFGLRNKDAGVGPEPDDDQT